MKNTAPTANALTLKQTEQSPAESIGFIIARLDIFAEKVANIERLTAELVRRRGRSPLTRKKQTTADWCGTVSRDC
jgi:hypothetical protein